MNRRALPGEAHMDVQRVFKVNMLGSISERVTIIILGDSPHEPGFRKVNSYRALIRKEDGTLSIDNYFRFHIPLDYDTEATRIA